jgi:hypothetical protein
VSYRLFSFLMALFWVFVQQTCLCCALWAWRDLSGRDRDIRPFAAGQALLLALLTGLAAADLWILSPVFPHDNNTPSPVWQLLCTTMLALDGGLLACEWSLCRLHRDRGSGRGNRPEGLLLGWSLVCLLLYGLYFGGALSTTRRCGLGPLEWEYLCLFYFRIVNALYLILEGAMGLIALTLWRNLRREATGHVLP